MPPNCTFAMRLPSRSTASMILPGTARHMIDSSPLFPRLGRCRDALPGPLVKTIARDKLAYQTAFPEIDSALKTEFLRIRCVIHDIRRQPVQQFRRAPQFFGRELDEDALELALAGVFISREQPPAGPGEVEVHDAPVFLVLGAAQQIAPCEAVDRLTDRKSTRLNSSHRCSSYAVFC